MKYPHKKFPHKKELCAYVLLRCFGLKLASLALGLLTQGEVLVSVSDIFFVGNFPAGIFLVAIFLVTEN